MTGREVRRIRQQLGLTQAELAGRIGVTANSVARWERGEMGIRPTAAGLLRLMAQMQKSGRER
jgi:transcriptional regulator with XRE-family HTH domain